ncbi:hypothetical protein D9M71_445180 [compost metagenome]
MAWPSMSAKVLCPGASSGAAAALGSDMASACMARMSNIRRLNSTPWLMTFSLLRPHFFDTHAANSLRKATKVPAYVCQAIWGRFAPHRRQASSHMCSAGLKSCAVPVGAGLPAMAVGLAQLARHLIEQGEGLLDTLAAFLLDRGLPLRIGGSGYVGGLGHHALSRG